MKSIFEDRYKVPAPAARDGSQAAQEIAGIGERYLEAMRKRPGRPGRMAYFEQIVGNDKRCREIAEFKAGGGKVIGVFCNFVPEELIYALGALPVRLCSGAFPAVPPAEEILARDVCPLVKSSFGLKVMGLPYAHLCDLVIVPTSCDAKKKCSKFFNARVPTWTLDLPQSKDYEKNLSLWIREIRRLKENLEEFCGKRVGRRALADSVRLLHRRTEAFRKLHELRKLNPFVLSGRDTLLAVNASLYDDPGRWTENMEGMARDLELSPPPPPENPPARVLLTGAPIVWPNWKLPHIIEEAGALIVSDTLCTGTQRLFDPVEVDEWTYDGMLRALAVKHLFPSICPCFIENAEHIDRVLELSKDFAAEGVIFHTLRLCQLFDMEFNHIAAVLRERSMPLINIVTDLSLEDEGQIRTRIEAFLEMIGSRI